VENEKDRVLRAKKDLSEFDYLYRKYFPKINEFVFHRVHNETEKNDIVSSVFFKAMKKLTLFRYVDSRRCSFQSWLYRIALNEINQHYRNSTREKMLKKLYRMNRVDLSPSNPDSFHNSDTDGLTYEIVREKMQLLSIDEQNLLTLRFFEKLSYREIAEICRKREGTVKVRVHRIINKLRDSLGG
jgi:RNA polymerase sigma-70 factor (ECF subfamily)